MRNLGADLDCTGYHRLAVGASEQHWLDVPQNAAVEAVRKDRFQTVADFYSIAMILNGKEQHDPFVLALLADAPLPEEVVRHLFDGIAIERRQRYKRHLNASGPLHVATIHLQLSA
jgi:hypothetical protein